MSVTLNQMVNQSTKDPLAQQAHLWAMALTVGLAVISSGCSSLAQDMYAHGTGWREASLVQIAPAGQIERRALTDCRTTATAGSADNRRYAVVEYRSGGRLHVHVLEMDESSQIRVGDTIHTNVLACGASFAARPPTRPP
jgi:hypothetical protein